MNFFLDLSTPKGLQCHPYVSDRPQHQSPEADSTLSGTLGPPLKLPDTGLHPLSLLSYNSFRISFQTSLPVLTSVVLVTVSTVCWFPVIIWQEKGGQAGNIKEGEEEIMPGS